VRGERGWVGEWGGGKIGGGIGWLEEVGWEDGRGRGGGREMGVAGRVERGGCGGVAWV